MIVGISTVLAFSASAMEVSFERDPNLPVVNINIAVKAGAVADPAGQSGLTNFLGEMMIRGTQSRTKEQIDQDLDQMGSALEVETRSEFMIFRGAVLGSQLGPFLKLLSEMLLQPSFPDGEIRKLKSELISGLQDELGNDSSLAIRRFNKFLFPNHPYGKPLLGTVKGVGGLTRAQLLKHYDRLIQDKLLLVVGTGDALPEQIKTWAEDLAKNRPGSGKDLEPVQRPENSPTRRLQLVDKPDRTQTQIFGGHLGVKLTDPDFFPLYLGNHAFGGHSFTTRLMVEIRVKRGWSYGANSIFRHGTQPRFWLFHLFPASKDTADALAYTIRMTEELKEKGLTPDEFEFSKRSLINSAGFMYNTPKKRVENKLLERTLDLPDDFMKSYAAELSKLSVDDVNSALKKFLKPDQLSITVLCTAKNMKKALADAAGVPESQVEVVPYTQD